MIHSLKKVLVRSGKSITQFIGKTGSVIRGDAIRNDLSRFSVVYDEVIKNLDQRAVELDQAVSVLLEDGCNLKNRISEDSNLTDSRLKSVESTINILKQTVHNAHLSQIRRGRLQILMLMLLLCLNSFQFILLLIGLILLRTSG